MTRRLSALALSTALVISLLSGAGSASTSTGSITGANTSKSCFAGSDGTCSSAASADPAGAFSASASLTSPESPVTRSTRYSMGLARYTIGFDLPRATREATIDVALQVDDAAASWTQPVPGTLGGTKSPNSGARVLFQLLGDEAPDGCGCGWPIQGSPDVVVAKAAAAGQAVSISDTQAQLTMVARNDYGDNLLPAGHYEVLLRAYALADLAGPGDWGTLSSSMSGRIEDVTVTIPSLTTNLTLAVTKTKSNRVLTARLTDADSAPLSGRTISFFGDGQRLGTAETQNGVATFIVGGKLRTGSHLFRAEYAGDDTYSSSAAEARS